MKRVDWAGKWFGILEELGELPLIPYGRLDSEQAGPEWVFLKHEEFDGIGGLAHLLRQEGLRIEQLPRLKEKSRPGIVESGLIFLRARKVHRISRMPWVQYDPSLPGRFQGIAWHRFTENQTLKLAEAARNSGVSTNSILLWGLDRAVLPLFETADFVRHWMMPVNMRGGVSGRRDTSNQSSYLRISIEPGMPVTLLHERVRGELRSKSHWGNWYSILSGRVLGARGMKRVLSTYRKNGHCWAGVFSNLGEWPPEAKSHSTPASSPAWLFGMPVTQGHPVGAGSLAWKGRVGITLQFHPSLRKSYPEVEACLDSWREKILECIRS